MQRYYSRIYWHFTGSPKKHYPDVLSPDDLLKQGEPKTEQESVDILISILQTQVLRATSTDHIGNYQTKPFCSTTDIPFKDLLDHSNYYGKAAIGFKASTVHDVFVPVFYLSSNHKIRNQFLVGEHPLMDFMKITDFNPKQGHTFYREREWRHKGDFLFGINDIAAIVVPDTALHRIKAALKDLEFPEDISVLSWRLIEEA